MASTFLDVALIAFCVLRFQAKPAGGFDSCAWALFRLGTQMWYHRWINNQQHAAPDLSGATTLLNPSLRSCIVRRRLPAISIIMSVVLATAGYCYDHKIRFWEARSGVCVRILKFADSEVDCCTKSP